MAESEAGSPAQEVGSGASTGGLSPQQLERLVELVYVRLKEDVLRNRERRGEPSGRVWR